MQDLILRSFKAQMAWIIPKLSKHKANEAAFFAGHIERNAENGVTKPEEIIALSEVERDVLEVYTETHRNLTARFNGRDTYSGSIERIL
jgi:hypothetical protein